MSVLLQGLEGRSVGEVVALSMGYGNLQDLTRCTVGGKGCGGTLNTQARPLTSVLEVVVSREYAGKQAGLAENLEAVADANDQPAAGGEAGYGRHNRGEAGYRPCPQIVSVGKPAGQDYAVETVR